MQYKIFEFTLGLKQDMTLMSSIRPKQGETGVKLRITLMDNGSPYPLSGTTAKVIFCKPDGTVSYINATVPSGTNGVIEVVLTNQVLAVPGRVDAEVHIEGTDGGNTILIKSWTFSMVVQKSVGAAEIESSNEVEFLTILINQAQEALDGMAAAISAADDATEAANTAAAAANTAAEYANTAGDYASQYQTILENHKNSNMPHLVQDITNNKTYRYGLRIQNGITQFIYEEVL